MWMEAEGTQTILVPVPASSQDSVAAFTLHHVSQQSLEGCPRNSTNAGTVEHRTFPTSYGGTLTTFYLRSSSLSAMATGKQE